MVRSQLGEWLHKVVQGHNKKGRIIDVTILGCIS